VFAWDDLRYVLAIARAGNLRAAARALGVDHSTMFRRLNALERALGAKLFERLPDGYAATESGRRLVEAAERIETETLALDRELSGRDTRLSGQLRVTASETLAFRALTDEIARFRQRHPGIEVALAVDNRVYDLSRREADVALRATRPREGDLFGRRLADIRWGFYASPAYLAQHKPVKRRADLDRHAFIGWIEGAAATKANSWLGREVPSSAIGFRTSGIFNQYVAAKAGLGIALLPRYLGDPDEALTRLPVAPEGLTTELWLITHRSLKDTARVRAFMETVGDGLRHRLATLQR
jgi:DNA-binding transcriptional LysR family regulator